MPETPYFVCDASVLRKNCEIVAKIRATSGAKFFFAIKSFTSCGIFRHMAPYFDGVVASSLYEARIGRDFFRADPTDHREVHAYSPAFCEDEFDEIIRQSDIIVFNSQTQQARFAARARAAGRGIGLRLNPEISNRPDLAMGLNFCSRYSRMGVRQAFLRPEDLEQLDGLLFHVNSENDDFARLERVLDVIEAKFGDMLELSTIRWVSLGGGISFTHANYPVEAFAARLRDFAKRWQVELYLEPGTAISSHPFTLHATVLDVIHNELPIAVLDISAEAHLPDCLMFDIQYPIAGATIVKHDADLAEDTGEEGHVHMIAGVSCLGGDEFGLYRFPRLLEVGDRVVMEQTGDYTMVQQTYFNGVRRPNVYYRHESGELELVKEYGYEDFLRLYR